MSLRLLSAAAQKHKSANEEGFICTEAVGGITIIIKGDGVCNMSGKMVTGGLPWASDQDAAVFFKFIQISRDGAINNDFLVGCGSMHESSASLGVFDDDAYV